MNAATPARPLPRKRRIRGWIERLPYAQRFRRSRIAVLLLRLLCALHLPQDVLEAYARRELRHG